MDMESTRRRWRRAWGTLGLVMSFVLAASPAAAGPPDALLTTKAKFALIGAEGLAAVPIDVDTFDGRVTLHGKVRSEADRLEAERLVREVSNSVTPRIRAALTVARSTEGVRAIRDDLEIATPNASR